MKLFFSVLFSLFFFNISYSQKNEIKKSSNFYLIRHAEKNRTDLSNKNPHLSDFGLTRSKEWVQVLRNIKFDRIYSTNYFRTKETAVPLAISNNLEITLYDHKKINYPDFLKVNSGMNILIVGHSNTIPVIVNSLIGSDKYKLISDDNNSNLYIITISSSGEITDKLLYVDLSIK